MKRLLWIALPVLWVVTLGSAAAAVYLKHLSREMFIESVMLQQHVESGGPVRRAAFFLT